MRKLLVVFLMVALIPFTVGCRLDGLWGFDDEDGTIYTGTTTTTTTALSTIPIAITVPSTISTTASIKSDFAATDGAFSVVLTDNSEVSMTVTASTSTTVSYAAATNVSVTKLTLDGTNYKVKIKIKIRGSELFFEVKIPAGLAVDSNGLSSTVTVTISALSFDASGVATITYTVTYIATGATTSTTTTSTTVTVTPTTTPLYVSKVIYAGTTGNDATELNGTTPITGVDITAPIFKVYFNEEITLPTTFTITASATDSTAKTEVTFTAAAGQLALALDSTKKIVTATITGQSSTKNASLNPGTTYKVKVVATVAASADATKTISVDSVFTFTTAQTKLTKWEAFNSAGTSLGSWTSGATATPTVTVGSISYINLTFDYGVAVPTDMTTATFNKTNSGTAKTSLKYTDYFATPTAVSEKVLKVALKTGTVVATGNYSVTYAAGTFKDVNGMAIDTSNTITFTGQ